MPTVKCIALISKITNFSQLSGMNYIINNQELIITEYIIIGDVRWKRISKILQLAACVRFTELKEVILIKLEHIRTLKKKITSYFK